jgi:exodeoxyribonuclease VII large subunit
MIEKGQGDEVVGKLEAVIWLRDLQRVERELRSAEREIADGLEIRCRGDIDFYPPFGRLQLVVREVDSVFLLGQLSRRRKETLESLAKAGLLEKNRGLSLALVPLNLALVTSEGSAAYHDFLATLRESGYGFRVLFLHAAVQGVSAEGEVASALKTASDLGVDCTVLIRGGGSRTDLAAFDSRRVSEAVARSTVPVITGLGHEIDLSITDQVAHTHTKTPTRAAEHLVQSVRSAEQSLVTVANGIQRACTHLVGEARGRLAGVEAGLGLAGYRVQTQGHVLARLAEMLGRSGKRRLDLEARSVTGLRTRLATTAPRIVGRSEQLVRGVGQKAAGLSRARLRAATVGIEAMARLCSQLGPERTLARGFSITRDARGRVVTAKEQVGVGDRIETEIAQGRLTSRVEE